MCLHWALLEAFSNNYRNIVTLLFHCFIGNFGLFFMDIYKLRSEWYGLRWESPYHSSKYQSYHMNKISIGKTVFKITFIANKSTTFHCLLEVAWASSPALGVLSLQEDWKDNCWDKKWSRLWFLVVVHTTARPNCSSHVKLCVVLSPPVKMGLLQWDTHTKQSFALSCVAAKLLFCYRSFVVRCSVGSMS